MGNLRLSKGFALVALLVCSGLVSDSQCELQPHFKYEFISMRGHSYNESAAKIFMKVDQFTRPNIYFSGYLTTFVPIDDNVLMGGRLYRSLKGVNDFVELPFIFKEEKALKQMNTLYKEYAQMGFRNCSNLPQIEDKLIHPLPPQNFTATRCRLSTETIKVNLPPAFYKVIISSSGSMSWLMEIVVRGESSYV